MLQVALKSKTEQNFLEYSLQHPNYFSMKEHRHEHKEILLKITRHSVHMEVKVLLIYCFHYILNLNVSFCIKFFRDLEMNVQ